MVEQHTYANSAEKMCGIGAGVSRRTERIGIGGGMTEYDVNHERTNSQLRHRQRLLNT